MNKPRVFVVQVPSRRDPRSGEWIEKFDLSMSEGFGELVRVLPPGNVPKDPEPTAANLTAALDGDRPFDADADFLLLLGDPVAIAHAAVVIGRAQRGPIRVLKWDRWAGTYTPYSIG